MRNFWPKRSIAGGFSIEHLASNCKDRLKASLQDDKKKSSEINSSNEAFNSVDASTSAKNIININRTSEIDSCHWANRDFKEYLDIA